MADRPGEEERRYTIGVLARELKVTTRAIRFYETKGLLRPQRNGTARSYSARDRARLILIRRGKNLGFSLAEIREYLELYDADPNQVTQLKHLKSKIDLRIAALQQKRDDVDHTLRELKTVRSDVIAALRQRTAKRG